MFENAFLTVYNSKTISEIKKLSKRLICSFFISFQMMQVIFVVIEYKISHFLAIIEFNRRKSLANHPFSGVSSKIAMAPLQISIKQIKLHQL
jgi:hypothetical protein